MIIFDLDGTLADCEHRRHFVDPRLNRDYYQAIHGEGSLSKHFYYHKETEQRFVPDWQAFYESCVKDTPIKPAVEIIHALSGAYHHIEIWSGRCTSVRLKTIDWLLWHVKLIWCSGFDPNEHLRMRPIGDTTADDVLKEKWLDEAISKGQQVDMVFDDRPKVVRMWRRRGIFVFNCLQYDGEF